jgi:hypothetical protein
MAVNEAMWKDSLVEKARKLAPVQQVNATLLRQAAVNASLLTGHPGWDKYLQALQVDLEEAEHEVRSLQPQMLTTCGDAQLRWLQIQLNIYTDRIITLKKCMTLPREIIAHAAGSGLF